MAREPEHFPTFPAPLSSDFDSELRRVDELLARQARRVVTPATLVDRVFEASVGLLPAPLVRVSSGRRELPLVMAGHRVLRFRTSFALGRLALAASVALAFVLAVRFMQAPAAHRPIVLVHNHGSLETLGVLRAPADSSNLEQWLDGRGDVHITELDYLLVTHDTTFSDLDAEMRMLAGDL
jgi:hypothetical protein